jgi:hypothetical protein
MKSIRVHLSMAISTRRNKRRLPKHGAKRNARFLFLEGGISKEEYLKRKEHNERLIAHWEARTTETERAAIELAICLDALENLAELWDSSENEGKQNMARVLFEYVGYDFDWVSQIIHGRRS